VAGGVFLPGCFSFESLKTTFAVFSWLQGGFMWMSFEEQQVNKLAEF
jgi:hypothetical protein